MPEIAYREYRSGDERAILICLQQSGYEPNERFWQWINRESPQGETIVELALVDDQVVGHYAVLPKRFNMDGTIVNVGQAIHAVVHPQFRGLVILQGLLQRIIQRCRDARLPMLYAFPNEQIWLVYAKLFQWRLLGDLVALERPLSDRDLDESEAPAISRCDEVNFDERYLALDCSETLRGKTYLMKDPAYLNWRYARHPTVHYQLLEAHTTARGLAGYAVLKRYEKRGRVYGHLVDFGLRSTSLALFPVLIAKALSVFRRQQVEVASCWLSEYSPCFETAREMGFQAAGFSTRLAYRLIDPSFEPTVRGLEQWHPVMGDSDAF